MDIAKDSAIDKKKFPTSFLASGLLIKPVTNNDLTKWDDFPKIENPSKKINTLKKKQKKTFLTKQLKPL